jgi:hypothetical protein
LKYIPQAQSALIITLSTAGRSRSLQVLCLNCHLNRHGPADTQGIPSWDSDIPNEDSDIKADVEVEKDAFSEEPIPARIHQS